MPGSQINITLGTAGHIDHGKTALVRLLTGCETDRLKEEKERGISIDLGFAPCTVGDLEIGIVDVPGHENFIKTMVAGACGMDAVLLVVAADDGVMPQTREHMEILTLLGVRHGFVALTKIDRVEPEHREMIREETQGFLQGTFLAQAPICPISSITGEGFDEFYYTLTRLLDSLQPKPLDGVFRLPVDRAFSARGYGTVVAGVPVCGSIGIGEELVLLPDGSLSSIRQIEVYGRPSDMVKAGQCAAINVRHWDAKRIRRGHVVTLPGYFTPRQWFIGRLRLLPHNQISLKNGTQLKFHTGTSEVTANVYLLEDNRIAAGEECLAQFYTNAPLVAGPGDHFIIRSLSPVRTVGGGVIIESVERKLKRTVPGLIDDVRQRSDAISGTRRFIEYAVRKAASYAASETDLAVRTKTRPAQVREILATMMQEGLVRAVPPSLFIHRDTAAELSRRVADVVAQFHRDAPSSVGISLDQLRERLPIDRPVLDQILAQMKAGGRLAERSAFWASPDHAAVFSGADAEHVEAIDTLFREAKFRPPGLEEICDKTGIKQSDVRRLLKILLEHERLVRVEQDILFHREAVDSARDMLVEFIRKEGCLESVKFKYLLDTSRRFAIPLLDHLDTLGITRRDGHTRYLKDESVT
jgi:selenocysteine-specific elongation factor